MSFRVYFGYTEDTSHCPEELSFVSAIGFVFAYASYENHTFYKLYIALSHMYPNQAKLLFICDSVIDSTNLLYNIEFAYL